VSELSSSNNSFQRKLAEALAQLSAETTQREALRSQAEGSEQQLRQLDERYRSLHEISGRERIMLQKEAERLREENEELQREGTATREDARNRNSEIMTLREDLRVSKESERQLAERVEIAEVSAAEHAERSGELERENLALIQQRDHHLHHAELLMKEKNRYFTQLQELRKRQAEEAASGDASAARATYARSVRVSTAPSLQKEKTRQKDKREGAKSVSGESARRAPCSMSCRGIIV
jgi:chromosome segregation ATPase